MGLPIGCMLAGLFGAFVLIIYSALCAPKDELEQMIEDEAQMAYLAKQKKHGKRQKNS